MVVLLGLAAYLQNVSEACRVMGDSRATFYRVRKACEEGGLEAIKEGGGGRTGKGDRRPEAGSRRQSGPLVAFGVACRVPCVVLTTI